MLGKIGSNIIHGKKWLDLDDEDSSVDALGFDPEHEYKAAFHSSNALSIKTSKRAWDLAKQEIKDADISGDYEITNSEGQKIDGIQGLFYKKEKDKNGKLVAKVNMGSFISATDLILERQKNFDSNGKKIDASQVVSIEPGLKQSVKDAYKNTMTELNKAVFEGKDTSNNSNKNRASFLGTAHELIGHVHYTQVNRWPKDKGYNTWWDYNERT